MTEDTLLEFPCDYGLKTFGKASPDYEAAVLTIVKAHVSDLKEDAITQRTSRDGNYLALTVNFTAESKTQLDAIYQDLSKHDLVLMAL